MRWRVQLSLLIVGLLRAAKLSQKDKVERYVVDIHVHFTRSLHAPAQRWRVDAEEYEQTERN